jgi:hypothetical protein
VFQQTCICLLNPLIFCNGVLHRNDKYIGLFHGPSGSGESVVKDLALQNALAHIQPRMICARALQIGVTVAFRA